MLLCKFCNAVCDNERIQEVHHACCEQPNSDLGKIQYSMMPAIGKLLAERLAAADAREADASATIARLREYIESEHAIQEKQRAEIERLTQQRDGSRCARQMADTRNTEQAAEIKRLSERVAKLTNALRPFARVGKRVHKNLRGGHCYHYDHLVRDYREAARVVSVRTRRNTR